MDPQEVMQKAKQAALDLKEVTCFVNTCRRISSYA